MTPSFSRRLLSAHEVCLKMGFSKTWLDRNADALSLRGFPQPIIKGDKGVPRRWDEHAIDLWLDAQIDPNLRHQPSMRDTIKSNIVAFELADKLKSRAHTISL